MQGMFVLELPKDREVRREEFELQGQLEDGRIEDQLADLFGLENGEEQRSVESFSSSSETSSSGMARRHMDIV